MEKDHLPGTEGVPSEKPEPVPATQTKSPAALREPEHHAPTWLNLTVKYTGYIGTPAAIVGTLCGVMSASAVVTSFSTLICMVLVSLCVFRKWIREHIPSNILLFAIIAMVVVFFVNYQTILLKDTGLLRYYKRSSDIQADLSDSLVQAKADLLFFGTNFHISATDQRTRLFKALERGVNVRYLVFDPFSPFLQRLAVDFDQSEGELRTECMQSLNSLLAMRERWLTESKGRDVTGNLEIKFYDMTPRMRAYFVDAKDADGLSYIVPYINGVNSPDLPAFKFLNIEHGVSKDYFSGVQQLWNHSVSVEEFLTKHPGAGK